MDLPLDAIASFAVPTCQRLRLPHLPRSCQILPKRVAAFVIVWLTAAVSGHASAASPSYMQYDLIEGPMPTVALLQSHAPSFPLSDQIHSPQIGSRIGNTPAPAPQKPALPHSLKQHQPGHDAPTPLSEKDDTVAPPPSEHSTNDLEKKALLDTAKKHLDEGHPALAWEHLQPHFSTYAGDPDFDYLSGLSALETGRPSEAIFAMERVLMMRPGSLPARAELARAHLFLNQNAVAQQQFQALLEEPLLPAAVRQSIEQYLQQLQQRAALANKLTFQGSLFVLGGYDSNPNFGSARDEWTLFNGFMVTPLADSLPSGSSVFATGAELGWVLPLNKHWQWLAAGHISPNRYPATPSMDQTRLDGATGIAASFDKNTYLAIVQFQNLQLAGDDFRNSIGLAGNWQYSASPSLQWGAGLYVYQFRFPQASIRDTKRVGGQLSLLTTLANNSTLSWKIQGGKESSLRELASNSHSYGGASVNGLIPLSPTWSITGGLLLETRQYDAAEPLFGKIRHDYQLDTQLGVQYSFNRHWQVLGLVGFTRNWSTLAPNDFDRVQATVSLRYQF